MTYKLIFKHPTTLEDLASLDFDGSGEEAAVAFYKVVAGHLLAELWQGGTLLRIIKPDTTLFGNDADRF